MSTFVLQHGPNGPGDFVTAFREYGADVTTSTSPDSGAVRVTPTDGQEPVVPDGATTTPVARGSWSGTDRYGVDTVSLDGDHVVQAVYRHRVDPDRPTVLRHRITVPDSAEREAVSRLAREALDLAGIRSGAGHVTVEGDPDGLRCTSVLDSPSHWPVPADLSFHAYGHSHQHLLAESLLQPEAFARRVKRAPRDCGSVLALAYLTGTPEDAITNPDISLLVRHLPGFAGIVRSPGAAGTPLEDVWGYVAFVHTDEPLVQQSLTILHELAASGQLWGGSRTYIDFNGRVS
ncbi:hypothetical protein EFK50_13750 [Nocardioides marmoriginsengisoli]|uniref:Uncharacterized protein n=1 Tax=Nocardioides marmoriginsengisoli TaxID=661483 RepID=A0A3N0CH78_9ACTN|nr:hypothetical protein [Nocardioides marmoriginsengisoli]RNL62804.1 hypothetical protein EFK50_13750 [Nocardioides marmoriginsengisoli]